MEEPTRAELDARLRLDDLYDDENVRPILYSIKLPGFKIGYVPNKLGNFVEIGENDFFSGQWVPKLDEDGKIAVKELTPVIYFRWKTILLQKLAMITDYRRFLDMRKKERFLVQKAVKAKHFVRAPATRILPGRISKRNIRRYQPREFDIPRAAIHRIACELLKKDRRFQVLALEALQSAAEAFLVGFFTDVKLAANHGGRDTIKVKDFKLARRIRRDD